MNNGTVVAVKLSKRIYMDLCCLNRPFDDQGQERIHLETEAIEAILVHVQLRHWQLIGSMALTYEAANLADMERRDRVAELMLVVREWVRVADREKQRAATLMGLGFKPLDAVHLACAETAGVDVMLTTDDRLLKNARRMAKHLEVRVANPMLWLEEQIL